MEEKSGNKAAGLVETLKGSGPFTVFAPTDDAFKALPAGTVETLFKPESKDQLARILTLSCPRRQGDGSGRDGQDHVAEVGDGVTVSCAKVVKADIVCTNGVIDVIDKVILPKA